MAVDPTSPAFWDAQRKMLRGEFGDLIMNVLLSGAASGNGQLPAELRVFTDWDVFNQSALDWMDLYLGDVSRRAPFADSTAWNWAANLNETTRRQVSSEISNWVRAGEALPELEKRLGRLPSFTTQRARQVAVTEVTRVYASGNLMAWEASGVVSAKRWRTAFDELVCPICGPMHMTIVEFGGQWNFTQEMRDANPELDSALNSLKVSGFTAPPAHVHCRCWLSPVILEAHTPEEIAEQRFDKPVEVVTEAPTYRAGQSGDKRPDGRPANEYNAYLDGVRWIDENDPLKGNQKNAVTRYSGQGYGMLNKPLRGELPMTQEIEKWADDLSSALQKLPKVEGEVYRGLNLVWDNKRFATEMQQALEANSPVTFPSFTSTSVFERDADKFGGNRAIMLKIRSKTGRVLGRYTVEQEAEILFDKGTRFRVLDVKRLTGRGRKFEIHLEEFT
jgi:hypothetical protein